MKNLLSIFPNASDSTISANPHLIGGDAKCSPSMIHSTLQTQEGIRLGNAAPTFKPKARRGKMNKTEAEYALILEAMKQKGDILRYEFEGITLRWEGIKYTPDFVVFRPKTVEVELNTCQSRDIEVAPEIVFIEIKGGFVGGKFERAIERFRHARTYWPEMSFEMMQKKGGAWTRLM